MDSAALLGGGLLDDDDAWATDDSDDISSTPELSSSSSSSSWSPYDLGARPISPPPQPSLAASSASHVLPKHEVLDRFGTNPPGRDGPGDLHGEKQSDPPASLVPQSCNPRGGDQMDWLPDHPLAWEQIADIMHARGGLGLRISPSRPPEVGPSLHHAIFVEKPKTRRRPKGSDVWACSGGVKGGLDYWPPTGTSGIRKRYGNINSKNGYRYKYHEFSLLFGARDRPSDDGSVVVFELFSPAWLKSNRGNKPKSTNNRQPSAVATARPDAQQRKCPQPSSFTFTATTTGQSQDAAVVDVRLRPRVDEKAGTELTSGKPRFISFQTSSSAGSVQTELGAIVQQGTGVTLESAQGDFAEWHRRCEGEPPLEEGDVIGFDGQGLISRRTAGATMLGVISRKAVVAGSTPPQHERAEYDTVAYCGVIPVKVRRKKPVANAACECDLLTHGPAVGNLLVPSGLNDGAAILSSQASESNNRVAIVIANCPWPSSGTSCEMLVPAMVTSPADTVRSSRYRTKRMLQLCRTLVLVFVTLASVLVTLCVVIRTRSNLDSTSNSARRSIPDEVDPVLAAYVVSVDNNNLRGTSRWRATNFSGVYYKTATVCNGRPVYYNRLGRTDGSGSILLLVESAPDWGNHTPGLHWTLREKHKGGFDRHSTTICRGPFMLPAPTVNGGGKPLIKVHDGVEVAGWASNCQDRPDAPTCNWHFHDYANIQVLATQSCTHTTSSCGPHAAACFKLPQAALLPSARCGSPPVRLTPGTHEITNDAGTNASTECVACTCKHDQNTTMYIGQQYCTNAFFVHGTSNKRYGGTFVSVRNKFCNGKPVFQMLGPGVGDVQFGLCPSNSSPVLFQPTGMSWWAIADGWDHRAFSLAASDPATHDDRCPSTEVSARSLYAGCPESPDGDGCATYWSEETRAYGRRIGTFKVSPLSSTHSPQDPRYCRSD